MPETHMTKADSQRIQSSQARGGRDMSSGGFAARAQSAADSRANQQASSKATGAGGHSSTESQKK